MKEAIPKEMSFISAIKEVVNEGDVKKAKMRLSYYSVFHLIGSRKIESAAYCNHILLVPLYLNSTKQTLDN